MPFSGLLAWRHPAPPPRPNPPAKPEWEKLAEEIISARAAGLDRIVFGDWPGTYQRAPGA